MNRNDWIFVGIRLLGLYLVVVSLSNVVLYFSAVTFSDGLAQISSFLQDVGRFSIGCALIFGAKQILACMDAGSTPPVQQGSTVQVSGEHKP